MRVEEYYYHSPLLEGEPVSHIIKMSKIIFKLLNSTEIGEMYIIFGILLTIALVFDLKQYIKKTVYYWISL